MSPAPVARPVSLDAVRAVPQGPARALARATLAAALLAAGVAHALTSTGFVEVRARSSSGVVVQESIVPLDVAPGAFNTLPASGGGSAAIATWAYGPGTLHLKTRASVSQTGVFAPAEAFARLVLSVQDDLYIHNNTPYPFVYGRVTVALDVSETIAESWTAASAGRRARMASNWLANISMQSFDGVHPNGDPRSLGYTAFDSRRKRSVVPNNPSETEVEPSRSGRYNLTLDFRFGEPITLRIFGDLRSDAWATDGWTADTFADLSRTLRWGGIQEVRGADGTLITDYTALGATSGFDYRFAAPPVPVPEPSIWVSLILGLGVIAWHRSRMRHVRGRAGLLAERAPAS